MLSKTHSSTNSEQAVESQANKKIFKSTLLALALLSLAASPAFGQSGQTEAENNGEELVLEEVITTGTRRKARSPSDTPAPVDIVNADALIDQGGSNMIDLLSKVVPSFTAHVQPNSGTATSIRPINLRGLSPDATVVLVNGKRRHRGSVVVTASSSNGLARGSQPVDVSAIPASALNQVEVLRDGAASG